MYSGWSTYEISGRAYKETEAREETAFLVEGTGPNEEATHFLIPLLTVCQ